MPPNSAGSAGTTRERRGDGRGAKAQAQDQDQDQDQHVVGDGDVVAQVSEDPVDQDVQR